MIEVTKLTRIKYNKKLYDIFVDKEHYKHFLEVKIKDGKEIFYHPNLHDLINLNLIYNTEDDIKYDRNKKYKFRENKIKNLKIKYRNLKVLSNTAIKIINIAICGIIILSIKEKVDNGEIPEIAIGMVEIKNNSELDEYNITNVTFDEVRKTLSENQNIQPKYKKLAEEYIDLLEKKLPGIDLRLLNENLKDMKLVLSPGQKLKEENAAGSYDADTNTLSLCTGYENRTVRSIFFHELTHSMTVFNGKIKIINDKVVRNQRLLKQYEENKIYGKSLDEGFTEILTNYLTSNYDNLDDYFKDENKKFVGYNTVIAPTCYKLLKLTQDEYSIYDFVSGNVIEYVMILKKYDLDGIIDHLDVITNSTRNKTEIIESDEFNEYLKHLDNCLANKKHAKSEKDVNQYKAAYILSKEFK